MVEAGSYSRMIQQSGHALRAAPASLTASKSRALGQQVSGSPGSPAQLEEPARNAHDITGIDGCCREGRQGDFGRLPSPAHHDFVLISTIAKAARGGDCADYVQPRMVRVFA